MARRKAATPEQKAKREAERARKRAETEARRAAYEKAEAERQERLAELIAPKVQREAVVTADGAIVRAPRVERDGLTFKRSTSLHHLAKRSEGMESPTIRPDHIRAATRLIQAWELGGEGVGLGASNYGERLGGGAGGTPGGRIISLQIEARQEIGAVQAFLGALWPAIYAVVIRGSDVTSYAAAMKKRREVALGYVEAALDRLVEFYRPKPAPESIKSQIRAVVVLSGVRGAQPVDSDAAT